MASNRVANVKWNNFYPSPRRNNKPISIRASPLRLSIHSLSNKFILLYSYFLFKWLQRFTLDKSIPQRAQKHHPRTKRFRELVCWSSWQQESFLFSLRDPLSTGGCLDSRLQSTVGLYKSGRQQMAAENKKTVFSPIQSWTYVKN